MLPMLLWLSASTVSSVETYPQSASEYANLEKPHLDASRPSEGSAAAIICKLLPRPAFCHMRVSYPDKLQTLLQTE